MHNHFRRNRKALSSLATILLLLIFAIIGGLISYLWVTGYYLSLKEKIPGEDIAVITNLSFNPQNVKAFNATVLNPSYSPYPKINVTGIAITGESEDTLHYIATTPSLPFSLSRGTNQTFTCTSNWAQYVNQTVTVSAFVQSGSGSTSATKLPYTALDVTKVNFDSTLGVSNFTITLRNNPLSATYLNITGISLNFTPPVNFTSLWQPSLPFTLLPNSSETFLCKYNWLTESAIGGNYTLNVETKQGYVATSPAWIPKLGATVQEISFNPADTAHFNVTVKNLVSTNPYLNVTRIRVQLDNLTTMNVKTTPSLSPSTNGVLGNQTTTFKCAWNWIDYRNRNVTATVYMLQGINATSLPQFTPPAGLLKIAGVPVFPDTQHFLVTVQNSPYSTRPANVTMIQVQLENGSRNTISGVYPYLPQPVEIGNTTMFRCTWNWTKYLNKAIDIIIHTNEGYSTFFAVTTPSNVSNYQVYLSIPSATFNKTDTAHFFVNVTNSISSVESANVTRIAVLLDNGTEINATMTSQIVPNNNSTTPFTCGWDWSTYRNKSIVILVYTNNGLEAIYVTKTS
jgi:hypothetical protein